MIAMIASSSWSVINSDLDRLCSFLFDFPNNKTIRMQRVLLEIDTDTYSKHGHRCEHVTCAQIIVYIQVI